MPKPRRVKNVWVATDPDGETFMYATVGSGERALILSIWPHDAPSPRRFMKAFQAGHALDERHVWSVMKAAEFEAAMYGHRGTPKDWSPRLKRL